MANLENEFALVDFLESGSADELDGFDSVEARLARYYAQERIARETGSVALLEVNLVTGEILLPESETI